MVTSQQKSCQAATNQEPVCTKLNSYNVNTMKNKCKTKNTVDTSYQKTNTAKLSATEHVFSLYIIHVI